MYKMVMNNRNFPKELEMESMYFVDNVQSLQERLEHFNSIQWSKDTYVVGEKSFHFKNREFRLWSTFLTLVVVYARETVFRLRWISFEGEIYKVGQFQLKGVCEKKYSYENNKWERCKCSGNPVLKKRYNFMKKVGIPSKKSFYSRDEIKSCCWILMGCCEGINQKEIEEYRIRQRDVDVLLGDISGMFG